MNDKHAEALNNCVDGFRRFFGTAPYGPNNVNYRDIYLLQRMESTYAPEITAAARKLVVEEQKVWEGVMQRINTVGAGNGN